MMKFFLFWVFNLSLLGFSQVWEAKSPYPALGRDDGIAFSLNGFGYCVTGNTGNFAQSNFLYRYEPSNNQWEKKAEFPAEARQYCTVFTVAEKAYIIGGYSASGSGLKEVWCYDGTDDAWTQKNDFKGGIRWGAFGFAIAGQGYFGCGTDIDTVYGDFWQYDPQKDDWSQLSDFPGGPRREGVACSAAGFGMAGLGFKTFAVEGFLSDWYVFDPKVKQWEKALDYPGGKTAWGKAEATGNSAIVGSGMDGNQIFRSAFYQFNILSRTWLPLPYIPEGPIRGCSSFAINNTVYFTTGLTGQFARSKQLTALNFNADQLEVSLFPNPSSGFFHLSSNYGKTPLNIQVFDAGGQMIKEQLTSSNLIDFSDLKAGLYFLKMTTAAGDELTKRLIIQ